jgi:pimeloyl-ACP methyl ester carboxylesterase
VSTFALVHAAWHGGWCWERLIPHLESSGHTVVAPDLPCDDPTVTTSDYARLLDSRLHDIDDDIILVGHSLGELTIPLVAALRPVGRLIFVCALLPRPGESWVAQLTKEPGMVEQSAEALERDALGRLSWRDEQTAIDAMYHDCVRQDARWAAAQLRPQASAPYEEVCPLDSRPNSEVRYILARDDRVVSPDWARRAVPMRLGVEPVEIDGGHSPFISQPQELAQLLTA